MNYLPVVALRGARGPPRHFVTFRPKPGDLRGTASSPPSPRRTHFQVTAAQMSGSRPLRPRTLLFIYPCLMLKWFLCWFWRISEGAEGWKICKLTKKGGFSFFPVKLWEKFSEEWKEKFSSKRKIADATGIKIHARAYGISWAYNFLHCLMIDISVIGIKF